MRHSFVNRSLGVRLRQGDYFGSKALLDAATGEEKSERRKSSRDTLVGTFASVENHATTGIALTAVTMLVLRKSDMLMSAKKTVNELPAQISRYVRSKIAKQLEVFTTLLPGERVRLVHGLPKTNFAEGSVVLKPGDRSRDVFFVVVRGTAVLRTGDSERTIDAGGYFGEEAFASGQSHTLFVNAGEDQPLEVAVLDPDLLNLVQGLLAKVVRRSEYVADDTQAISAESTFLSSLKDVTVHAFLGSGAYGSVKLARIKGDDRVFALKTLLKAKVIAKRQVEHVTNERKLLAMCDHPFIIELVGAFQDFSHLYLVMELMLGGELFSLLERRISLNEAETVFYASNICIALEYLHDRRIAYRDLKPENMLLDARGYLKIIDFGFAKVVPEYSYTWTLCGTPEYIAPECILRRGHDCRTDWWSMGVLVYELLMGSSPFYDDEQFQIFKNILACNYKPLRGCSVAAASFVSKLLQTKPEVRLTSSKGSGRDVREHNFFLDVDFLRLQRRELEAPYVPPIAHPADTSNITAEPDDDDDDDFDVDASNTHIFDGFKFDEDNGEDEVNLPPQKISFPTPSGSVEVATCRTPRVSDSSSKSGSISSSKSGSGST